MSDDHTSDHIGIRRRLFRGSPILAIARGVTWEDLESSCAALIDAGFPAVEVTLDNDAAVDQISRLHTHFAGDLTVGAGTVRTVESAHKAVGAGAEFLVSPSLDAEVLAWAVDEDVPIVPGVLTPTEMDQAVRAGASAVKIFPAGPLGPGYLKAVSAPMPEIPIVPTGGISVDEVAGWLEAGAVTVGLGGALFGGSSQGAANLLSGLSASLERWMNA